MGIEWLQMTNKKLIGYHNLNKKMALGFVIFKTHDSGRAESDL